MATNYNGDYEVFNGTDFDKINLTTIAANVSVADSGGILTATNVEDALQELAGTGRTTETIKSVDDKTTALDNKIAVLNGTGVVEKMIDYAVASGTDSYLVTDLSIVSYIEGKSIKVKFTNANTGASTLNINSLGAIPIQQIGGKDVKSGDIKEQQVYHLVYNVVNSVPVFQLLGASGGGSGSDLEAREMITALENKLQEANLVSFVNKTGIGFYDTFEDEDFVDMVNTSALYNGSQSKFNFNTIIPKTHALASVSNSTSISVDQLIYTGDIIEGATVTNVTNTSVQIAKDFSTSQPVVYTGSLPSPFPSMTKTPLILDNGWEIITNIYTSTITFLVSKDNGASWSTLCTFTHPTGNQDYSLAFKGTTIFLLTIIGGTELWCYSFDAYTTDNVNIYTTYAKAVRIDWNQSFIRYCHIIITPYNKLVAVWSGKNSTYSLYNNLRIAYSVDLNTTWSTTIQLTNGTTTATYCENPFLVSKSNGDILVFYNTNLECDTMCGVLNSDLTGMTAKTVTTGAIHNDAYANFKPNALLVKYGSHAGRVICAVSTYSSATAGYIQINLSYSDDGGNTWNNAVIVPPGTSVGNAKYCTSICQDTTGKIVILYYYGTTNSNVWELHTNDCITYSAVNRLINVGTSSTATYPVACPQVETFTSPMIFYYDSVAGALKLFGNYTINTNNASVTLNSPITVTLGQTLNLVRTQRLSMNPQTFSNFTNLKLGVFAPTNKALIKNAVNNSTSVVTLPSGRVISANDVVFMNGVLNNVVSATANNVQGGGKVSFSTLTGGNSFTAPPLYLSNGWIINAVAASSRINFYVSKDNGVSWTLLTYASASISSFATNSFSMCSLGTVVYFVYGNSTSNNYYPYFSKFDATVVGSTVYASSINSTTYFSATGISIDISSNGVIFVVGATGAGSSPSAYVIKSMDGGASWYNLLGSSGVTSVGTLTGLNCPNIVVLSDTTFHLTASNSTLQFLYWNGSTFSASVSLDTMLGSRYGLYVQKYGVHAGRVWIALATSASNIETYYTDNHGGGFARMDITTGTVYPQIEPSITEDTNGNVYLVWTGKSVNTPNNYNLRMCSYNGSSLSSITELTSRTDDNNLHPIVCQDINNFTIPLIAFQDTYNYTSMGTFTVQNGWNLTLQNPVTANIGDSLYLQDFTVNENGVALPLESIDDEKHIFASSSLSATIVDLDISSNKTTECTSIAYAIS